MSYAVIVAAATCLTYASKTEAIAAFRGLALMHNNVEIFAINGSHHTNLTASLLRQRVPAHA